jgi:tetratricopeptide (TPR) repeat protein
LIEAIRRMPGRFVEVPESLKSHVPLPAMKTFSAPIQDSCDLGGLTNLEHLKELIAEASKQYESGNHSATIELLRHILALAPADPRLLTRLARMLYNLGEVLLARKAAERALNMDANDRETLSIAVRVGATKRQGEAMQSGPHT